VAHLATRGIRAVGKRAMIPARAGRIVNIASSAGKHITGQQLAVDGGVSAV
jgi:NAD(P)-dependent dehydrogenase (short-subunit alcohol dehydrogenase family)